ncbi:hypothetical protein Lal_00046405 [Lupinus albus]|nr:hypothetical protein Lal_00046405 [Lupinus albus]
MAELQTKVETASALPPVVAEPPSQDIIDNNNAAETSAPDESKALVVDATIPASEKKQTSRGSIDRDIALAEITKEKSLSYVKAWEESEKSKAENRAQKHLSGVSAWENSQKAALEAKLKKIEEELERKKAEYGERIKNRIALVHKEAEEKRAMVEAKRGEEVLKAEEMAAKYRATRTLPKKTIGCF